jgi:hypothetical protein
MDLTINSDIAALRAKVEEHREAAMTLMRNAGVTAAEAAGLHRLAMELHDMDRALSDAVFLNNSSKISKLIGEIEEATVAGAQARNHLTELRDAVVSLRKKLKKGTSYLAKAESIASEVEQLVDLAEAGKTSKSG